MRAHDFGEMIVYITVGVFFLLVLLFSYSKSDLTARKISNNLLFLLAILTFFGFFIDMLSNIICNLFKANSDSNLISIFSDILEDGGEMLVISLTA